MCCKRHDVCVHSIEIVRTLIFRESLWGQPFWSRLQFQKLSSVPPPVFDQASATAASDAYGQGYTQAYTAAPVTAAASNSYYNQTQPANSGYPAQPSTYQQPAQAQQQQSRQMYTTQQQPTAQYTNNNSAASTQQYAAAPQQQQYTNPSASSYAPAASSQYNNTYAAQSSAMYQNPGAGMQQQLQGSDQGGGYGQQAYNPGNAYNEPAAAVYNPKRTAPTPAPMSSAQPPPAAFAPTTSANPPTAPQQQQQQQIARQPSYPPNPMAQNNNMQNSHQNASQPTAGYNSTYQAQPQQQQQIQSTQMVQQPSFFAPTANTPITLQPSYTAASGMQMSGAPTGGSMVAPAPASQRPAPVQAPGPPPNISITTADVSAIPAAYLPIVTSLTNLFNSCIPLANNPGGCTSEVARHYVDRLGMHYTPQEARLHASDIPWDPNKKASREQLHPYFAA